MGKKKHIPFVGKAELSKLGNDLFWEVYFLDEDMNFIKLRWTGYNDGYWWTNVSVSEQAQITQDKFGRKYKIDFATKEVKEIENE